MHCVLVLNAGYFATNSPKVGANGGSLEYKFILPHSHAAPFLHQNEPSRESIFCDKVSTWWIKRALMMLNFLLKIRQKHLCRRHVRGQRYRNHIHLLSTVRAVARHVAHGQRIQHYGNAEVKLPLTASFQLVDVALNTFCQVAFLKHNHALPQAKGGQDFRFYRIFVPTSHMGGVFVVVLRHKGHKPLSIYRNIKSQNIFMVENNKQCHESRIVEESFYVSSRDK